MKYLLILLSLAVGLSLPGQTCYRLIKAPTEPPDGTIDTVLCYVKSWESFHVCDRITGYMDCDPMGWLYEPCGVKYYDRVNHSLVPVHRIRQVWIMEVMPDDD